MAGKTLASRVFLLIFAIALYILLKNYGVSSEIMTGATILIIIRVIFLFTMVFGGKNDNSEDDKISEDENI